MQRALHSLLGLILFGGIARATSQSRPPGTECPPAAAADTTWPRFSFPGLRFSLLIPGYLRPEQFENLERVARRVQADGIPSQSPEASQLVAAWQSSGKSPEPVRRVLLFTTRPDSLPPARSCWFMIGGQSARVFRHVLSGSNSAQTEYWLEAYWPGLVLAIGGTSPAAYVSAFTLLTGITTIP